MSNPVFVAADYIFRSIKGEYLAGTGALATYSFEDAHNQGYDYYIVNPEYSVVVGIGCGKKPNSLLPAGAPKLGCNCHQIVEVVRVKWTVNKENDRRKVEEVWQKLCEEKEQKLSVLAATI